MNLEEIKYLINSTNIYRLFSEINNNSYSENTNKIISLLDKCNDDDIIYLLDCYSNKKLKFFFSRFLSSEEMKKENYKKYCDHELWNFYISNSSDELKSYFIEEELKEFDYISEDNIILLSSDELKEKYLSEFYSSDSRFYIVKSFKEDKIKEKYIDEFFGYGKELIIKSFKSDELKEKYLLMLPSDSRAFKSIAQSIKDVSLRGKYIDNLEEKNHELEEKNLDFETELEIKSAKSQEGLFSLISILNSKELIKKYLDKLEEIDDAVGIIIRKNLGDEVLLKYAKAHALTESDKIFILNNINNINIIKNLIDNNYILDEARLVDSINDIFSDDNYKMQFLSKIKEEQRKSAIVASLNDDTNKEKFLNLFTDEFSKSEIIKSFKDDNLKLKYLDAISSYKFGIFESIKDDNIKIKALEHCKDDYDKAALISSFSKDELKLKYIELVSSPFYKANIYERIASDEEKIKILSTLEDFNPKYRIISSLKEENYKKIYIKMLFSENSDRLFQKIIHYENDDKNIKIVDYLKDELLHYCSQKYNVNLENLKYISSKLGYKYIHFINNSNFQKIINSDKETVDKILSLISCEDLNMSDVNNIYNSLVQKRFTIKRDYERSIFNRILHALDEKDIDSLNNINTEITTLPKINKIFDDKNFINKISIFGFSRNSSLNTIIQYLYNNILNNTSNEEFKDILHFITDYYIMKLRENDIEEYNKSIDKNIKFTKKPNFEKQIKSVFEFNSHRQVLSVIKNIDVSKISDDSKALLENEDILKKCIKFKHDPSNYNDKIITSEILKKEYLRKFQILLHECHDQGLFEEKFCFSNETFDDVPGIFDCSYDILCNLNYELISKTVLQDNNLYEKVEEVLKNYKLPSWGETFNKLLIDCDIEFNPTVIADLINYSYKVLNSGKNLGILELIEESNLYSSFSNRYQMSFGRNNYKYLVNNPGPNSASLDKGKRLDGAIDIYKKMLKRDKISIPPLSKEISLGDKNIKVITGDISNPMNLTYGERTGACMRIGGAGSTLFEFCNLNENGFHIRFEDAKTGEFLSRVSGFRNGNTVFLNQLRDSVNKEQYSNNDLIESLKDFSKMLIEETKDSLLPIENVVISSGFAMASMKDEGVFLGVQDIKQGLNTNFYTDVSATAIVLATSSKDQYAKLNLGVAAPLYNKRRLEPLIISNNKDALEKVNHINLIEGLITEKSLDDVLLIDDALFAVTGEDWYIYIDKYKSVHTKIIDGITEIQKQAAGIELDEYLLKVNTLFGGSYAK